MPWSNHYANSAASSTALIADESADKYVLGHCIGLEPKWHCGELAQVRVVLAGVDKFDNLFGSVVYADAEERPVDLGKQLLRAGLARVRDQLSPDGPRTSACFP